MKYFATIPVLLLIINIPPLAAQTDYVPANIQLHEDIESSLVHLRNAKAERDAAENDLAISQKALLEVESRMHAPEEQRVLMERVQKDRQGSWTFLQEVFKDLGYLKSQWGFLTPEERATVDEITSQLTRGT